MAVVTHTEWVGDHYVAGIQDQRIAIAGFSHWDCLTNETPDFTLEVIQGLFEGRNQPFFDRIQEYFSYKQDPSFWQRVVFFNFIPDLVGDKEQKFSNGTPEQHYRGRERFLQILGKHRPHKIVFFSRKAWDSLPAFRVVDPESRPLGAEFHKDFCWGTYERDNHVAAAFGLRHTLGANTKTMTQAVRRILETSLNGPI